MLTKRVFIKTLLICSVSSLMFFLSCSKNSETPFGIDNETNFSLNNATNLAKASSPEELRTHFDELSRKMAQKASRVIEKILASEKMLEAKLEVDFDELELDTDLARAFLSPEGLLLKTTLERAKPSNINPKSKSAAIIFAPDPDRFQPEEMEHICTGWLAENGDVQPIEFTKDEYEAKLNNIPLYLVGFKEIDNNVLSKSGNSSSTIHKIASSPYAAVHSIRFKTSKETWGNHEFEVYLKLADLDEYSQGTTHKFDGISKNDAAGRYVYYSDINDKGVWYSLVDEPAFFALDSKDRGWIAIEDDYIVGTHNQGFQYGCQSGYPCSNFYVVDVQFADFSANYSVVRRLWYMPVSGTNLDDVWTKGCYEEFTSSWTHSGSYDWFALNHNDFRMKRNDY